MIQSEENNIKTQSVDTSQEAEEVLISLIREVSFSEKISQICSLSQTAFQLTRRAIVRANKDKSEREIDILFVSTLYGEELAHNLEKYLDEMEHEDT